MQYKYIYQKTIQLIIINILKLFYSNDSLNLF